MQTAGGADAFTCEPRGILRREKHDDWGDLLRLAEPCREWRSCGPRVTSRAADKAAVSVTFSVDQPGRDDINPYVAWSQFFRERQRDRIDRALRAGVKGRIR